MTVTRNHTKPPRLNVDSSLVRRAVVPVDDVEIVTSSPPLAPSHCSRDVEEHLRAHGISPRKNGVIT